MTSALQPDSGAEQNPSLASLYGQVRCSSVALCAPLTVEDMVVQSMPDTSPGKWHLAHVSWFFEHFILSPYVNDYLSFNPKFDFLFNSYYFTVGQMHQRPRRGLLSRPTVREVLEYRHHVDEHMQALLETHIGDPELAFLATLGLNHEQQHQELLLTDIKHVLAQNPLKPAYRSDLGEFTGPGARLVEFRSGSSTKTRMLLDHLRELAAYVPVDISRDHLLATAEELARDYPGLEVQPVCADFTHDFELPGINCGSTPRCQISLQHWCGQAGKIDAEAPPERPVLKVLKIEFGGMGEVILKHGFHFSGEILVHHQCCDFKIEPE